MAVDGKLVAAKAREAGWEVDASVAGELRLVPPDGVAVVVPTEKVRRKGHKEANDLATLRRLGLAVDDTHEIRKCEHSWHAQGKPGRFCPYCRATWREEPVKRNMASPPQRERLECPRCPKWYWVSQRDAYQMHVAGHDDPEPELNQPRPEPEPVAPLPKEKPAVAAKPVADTPPAPPEPTVETETETETITYEVATIDGKGRLVLRDEAGDLFVAVPLMPMV